MEWASKMQMPLGDPGNKIVKNKVENRGKDYGTREHMPLLKRQPLNSSGWLCRTEGLWLPDLPIFKERLEILLYVIFLIFKMMGGAVPLFGGLVRICRMSLGYLWSRNLITTG